MNIVEELYTVKFRADTSKLRESLSYEGGEATGLENFSKITREDFPSFVYDFIAQKYKS